MTSLLNALAPLAAVSDLTHSLVVEAGAPGVRHAIQSRQEPSKVVHVAFGEWPTPVINHPDSKSVRDFVKELEAEGHAETISKGRRQISSWIDTKPTLRSLRLAAGLSQEELATKLQTSQSQVARIESGRQDPHLKTLKRMAEILGVSLHDAVDASGV
jgi:ribosome-binding protein aMBF1 (putative translation factor)